MLTVDRVLAVHALLEQPDPPDLPPRAHGPFLGGDPVKQQLWLQRLPLVYVQHQREAVRSVN